MATYPIFDPESTKYPDRVFHNGQWRTTEQMERERVSKHIENLSPERAERRRFYGRKENMTSDQIDRRRKARRKYERKRWARGQAKKQAFDQKLGKLLKLSVSPSATEHERTTAREKYHLLKGR